MLSKPLSFVKDELETLKKDGLYNSIRTLEGPQGPWVAINGEPMLNFCSNNYLGLAADPRLKEAAQAAIHQYGVGPGAVRSIAGTMTLHQKLEAALAKFKKVPAVISFQSGFAANLAVIPALVGKGDTIYSDSLNHASIIDGCRLSRAEIRVYDHCNMESLEERLREPAAGRKLIITDGVFSMDGDIAPLPAIVELAEKYGAMTMVDDAHGEGVLGTNGRGIVDHFGLHGRVDVEVGTLSKALGVVGGFVAGASELIEYLAQRGRPFLFSSAVTPADVAAAIAAVEILDADDELVQRLWDNARYFKSHMQKLGFDIGRSETPITPVMIGEAAAAAEFSRRLFEEKVFAQSIGFPTVPRGRARIRVMVSASHSREDLDYGIKAFEKVGRAMGLI
ncbi:MAG: glycine C-acetyltransferase [Firmicutes bacterium]|jgi:glycine C-acetyltransferase|nr:glycine C-acetyltransferase [Bacillota bacterium]